MERRNFLSLGVVGLGASYIIKGNLYQQFYPKVANPEWAVLFGSWYGSSRDASVWISEGMGGIAQVYDIQQNPDLSKYKQLVIGTSIHGGKGPEALDAYLEKHRSKLKNKIRGLFIVCGNRGEKPGPDQVTDYIDKYLIEVSQADKAVQKMAMGGRITKRLLSKEDYDNLESFHKSMNKPYIDYDNLSRWDCLEFGQKILKKTQKG